MQKNWKMIYLRSRAGMVNRIIKIRSTNNLEGKQISKIKIKMELMYFYKTFLISERIEIVNKPNTRRF